MLFAWSHNYLGKTTNVLGHHIIIFIMLFSECKNQLENKTKQNKTTFMYLNIGTFIILQFFWGKCHWYNNDVGTWDIRRNLPTLLRIYSQFHPSTSSMAVWRYSLGKRSLFKIISIIFYMYIINTYFSVINHSKPGVVEYSSSSGTQSREISNAKICIDTVEFIATMWSLRFPITWNFVGMLALLQEQETVDDWGQDQCLKQEII